MSPADYASANYAPANYAPKVVQPSQTRIPHELKDVTVSAAASGEASGRLNDWVAWARGPWKEALGETLARMGIFEGGGAAVSLSVRILKFESEGYGDKVGSVTARYELIDAQSGRILYSGLIGSTATAPYTYAFLGETRIRESLNRAVRNNVAAFVEALRTTEIN